MRRDDRGQRRRVVEEHRVGHRVGAGVVLQIKAGDVGREAADAAALSCRCEIGSWDGGEENKERMRA